MRTGFYESSEKQAQLVAEAKTWAQTPFRENSCVKGPQGGVDCTRFVAAVHAECGACQPLDFEVLPVEQVRHWHKHSAVSRMIDFFDRADVRQRIFKVEDDEPRMIGDLVGIKIDLCVHHLGLWLGDKVAHVSTTAGVLFTSTQDPKFQKMIAATYRITAP